MNVRLLSDIDSFLASSGLGEFRFGILAARNGRLVERLRKGGRVWPETEAQIRGFMIAHGASRKPPSPSSSEERVA